MQLVQFSTPHDHENFEHFINECKNAKNAFFQGQYPTLASPDLRCPLAATHKIIKFISIQKATFANADFTQILKFQYQAGGDDSSEKQSRLWFLAILSPTYEYSLVVLSQIGNTAPLLIPKTHFFQISIHTEYKTGGVSNMKAISPRGG